MRIISDITGKEYKTVEECLAAEKLFTEKKEAEAKAKEEHDKAIKEAYDKAMAAIDEYFELVGIDFKETKDGYRVSYHGDSKSDQIWEDIINAFLG